MCPVTWGRVMQHSAAPETPQAAQHPQSTHWVSEGSADREPIMHGPPERLCVVTPYLPLPYPFTRRIRTQQG